MKILGKIRIVWKDLSIRTKLTLSFMFTSLILISSNILLYREVNQITGKIDSTYISNVQLNDLANALATTQDNVHDYLNTKSSGALESYYRSEQDFRNLLENLNTGATDNQMLLLEKNIKNMSDSYLRITNDTVTAKRGSDIEKYNMFYKDAEQLHQYINTYIYQLNNQQFSSNTRSYQALQSSLYSMEVISTVILITVCIINVFILGIIIKSITEPLSGLAKTANEVAAGNLNTPLIATTSKDEVGIVTSAFNQMVYSINEYIQVTKDNLEKERKMKEQELLMETHLKDAQLKYLQAQINPHFLFNSLNAGAQLAMMENAEKTCLFIERMADFFRYNVRKLNEDTTLGEEIEAVNNYIYILNVRFAGDIHFEKNVDPSVLNQKVPSMILQPLVENAVQYGIRDIDWQGILRLEIIRDSEQITIYVKDNGKGMEPERIKDVLEGSVYSKVSRSDSTGIGIKNVLSRIALYYNKNGLFHIESEGIDKGTTVTIHLPLDK